MSYLYILINFSKLYRNLFTWLTHKKSYGVRHSVRAVSNLRRRLHPPPPTLCSHYTTWGKITKRRRKIIRERQRKWAVGVREVGGVKYIRRHNNFPVAGAGGTKTRKKSHSAENCCTVPKTPYPIARRTLIHYTILIHCRPILKRTYLNSWPKLRPILIHGRNYTLS